MEMATKVADSLISDTRTVSTPVVEEIAESTLYQAADKGRLDLQCLIVSLRPDLRLFRLRKEPVDGLLKPVCQEISSKAVAGDDQNPAIFWAEGYYLRRPIKELVLLAAHHVTAAAKLNSGAIGGLEMVLCDASGIHALDQASNRTLESNANDLGERLHTSFASYSQQFTYAPNVIR